MAIQDVVEGDGYTGRVRVFSRQEERGDGVETDFRSSTEQKTWSPAFG
jgi:hypothetical protein